MTKFITNKISLQKGSFNDLVQKVLNKGVEKVASATEEVVKVAEQEEGKDSGQPAAEAKLVNVPKKEEGTVKGKEEKCECVESGQPQAEAKLVNKPEVKEEPYGGEKKEEKKEAKAEPKFQKIAKLDAKTRSFLKDYWSNLYPAEYVEAMLSEQ